MIVHYYLSVFPIEALIASALPPELFGAYMATGWGRGGWEPHSFIELREEPAAGFDLEYAQRRFEETGPESETDSVYLSIYQTLEQIPLGSLGTLHLTTRDGRTLGLEPERVNGATAGTAAKPCYIYQEMCPVRPVVVTKHEPAKFVEFITAPCTRTRVPRIVFADLRVIDLADVNAAGNIGGWYHQNLAHLESCISAVTGPSGKATKTLDRARVESFSYQLIDTGVYVGDQSGLLRYRMKSHEELRMHHYPWAKSSMIL
jgi:hypothetical protein